ncbi:hypothetical protein [Streptomyces sp. NPDC014734]|uniref:hypothetical protein n=1 Tax=Streptomyces sp. NPDC014734 TaxID=3364886 RepID=UPI0036FA0448
MARRGARIPSGRLCAGIVLGILAGLVTLWLLMRVGHSLYTTRSWLKTLLLPGAGIAVGCAVSLGRAGTGIGHSWGLLAGIAAMFFCATHMQYLSSNALHDRGQEVYGVIQKETSATHDPDGGPTTYSYAVAYPGDLRQRELSTVGRELQVGGRYLITVDPESKVHPKVGPRPGTDVSDIVWQIICAVFLMPFCVASVAMSLRPDELTGW